MQIIASDRQPSGPWKLYRTLVGLGLLCGLLIAVVVELTMPIIAANRAAILESALYDVLPGVASIRAYTLVDDSFRVATAGGAEEGRVYAGFDERGELIGVARTAGGVGYQDRIELLYGYDPARQQVIGLRVLENRETPGLGDRIEDYGPFLANFTALDLRLQADGAALLNPPQLVAAGNKTRPWQVDGISGATISSRAVTTILADSASRWAPLIHRRRHDFTMETPP